MTTGVRAIVERRLLYALEQTAVAEMPPGWRGLDPADPHHYRGGARILQRLAELPGRAAMDDELKRMAREIQKNREDRAGELLAWLERVEQAVGRLEDRRLEDRREGSATGLPSLALWDGWAPWEGPESPLTRLHNALGALSPLGPAGSEEASEATDDDLDDFLDDAACVLLRCLARRWAAKARQEQQQRAGGDEEGADEPEGAAP